MSSIAGAAASKTLWGKIKSVPIQHPFAFGFFLSGFKTSFSDLLVQKVVEQRETIDWKRNAAFASFGFFYLGGVQYAIYVPLFSRMFPGAAGFAAKSIRDKLKDAKGMFQCGAQVVLDQCVHHPLMYFPVFYCTRELVVHDKPDLKRCLNEYRGNMKEDLVALWKVWVPSTIINFAFMPMWARIPFVAATSLLWTSILSAMRGGDVSHGEEMAGGAVTGATLTMVEAGFESLFTSNVELDRDSNHLVITASGPDRVGWIATLSRAIADQGGNITHSKQVRLGSSFICVLHTAVDPELQHALMKRLEKIPELEGLSLQCNMLTRRATGSFDPPVMGVRLHCAGEDKPGMLASITESLANHGLSLENVTTSVRHNKKSGCDFVVDADCTLTRHLDQDQIKAMVDDLNHLKQELDLSTVDIRVQRLAAERRGTIRTSE